MTRSHLRRLQLRNCLHQTGLEQVCGPRSWLTTETGGPRPRWEVPPWAVALGYIRKRAGWATGSNPVSVAYVLASDCLSEGLKPSSKLNSFLLPRFSSMFLSQQLNCCLCSDKPPSLNAHVHWCTGNHKYTLILPDKTCVSLRGAIFNDHDWTPVKRLWIMQKKN